MKPLWFTSEQIVSLSGLRPKVWLVAGQGFSREDIKSEIFKRGLSLGPDSVQSVQSLALRVLALCANPDPAYKKGILGASGRQEILRQLLKNRALAQGLPELKRLKRQGGFFKRLDRAIQSLRVSSLHWDEALVFHQRLEERRGQNPVREQILILSQAYDHWLKVSEVLDPPALLRAATAELQAPESFLSCEKILVLVGKGFEPVEKSFVETLRKQVELEFLEPTVAGEGTGAKGDAPNLARVVWNLSHTIQDAASELAESWYGDSGRRENAILIPDEPSVRRALLLALADLGIKAQDPRDPTRLRWDEELKAALAPLEVVAQDYAHEAVIRWLSYPYLQADRAVGGQGSEDPHAGPATAKARAHFTKVIYERAIKKGLNAYRGADLGGLRFELDELQRLFGKKQKLADLADAHLKYLSRALSLEMQQFIQTAWQEALADLTLVGAAERRAPVLFWLEWMRTRLSEATPPVERLRYEGGIQIFRLSQAPLYPVERLWILGAPPRYLSGEGSGDLWLSDQDRETLASEFEVRAGSLEQSEKKRLLQLWIAASAELVTFMDFEYDWNGRERESLKPLLNELGLTARIENEKPVHLGAFSRWLPSFSPVRMPAREAIGLKPLLALRPEQRLPATELDLYSKCPFMALAARRWKLSSLRPSDQDLWADVRGILLHHAVTLLLKSRNPEDGRLLMTPSQSLEEAWSTVRLKGFISSPRLERYVRARLLKVLEVFCEKETQFFARAQTQVLTLENREEALEFAFKVAEQEWVVHGIPDRIDEHPASNGLFVMDYKTSSALPSGRQMIEEGFALQLPFYALAAQKKYSKEVVGAQFIELSAKGGRTRGIFFEKFNGKKPGCLTSTTRANASLLPLEPQDAWALAQEKLTEAVRGWTSGEVRAIPKDPAICESCRFFRVCGRGRL